MRAALALLGSLAGACTAASPELGLDAALQVSGAQFRPGPFPGDEGGPAAVALVPKYSAVTVGIVNESVRGLLELDATGAALGIAGHDGAWIIAAGGIEFEAPDNVTARATVGLSPGFPAGPVTLLIAASDGNGRFGAPASAEILAVDAPVPDGELVIGLTWSGPSDLDIHVVDPLGGEAYSRDPNTYPDPVPGEPVDPTAYLAGGILDHDGNKDCHRDGAPNEHVVWKMPPPDGTYTVRVDARGMCGAPSAAWEISAYRSGVRIGTARGVSTQADVLQAHGDGAGVLALQFTCSTGGCTTSGS